MGNRASLCHPVAGQGLNLALRDMDQWLTLLHNHATATPTDATLNPCLDLYESKRHADHLHTTQATHLLAQWFNLPNQTLSALGSAGLLTLDCIPQLKKWIALYGAGYRQPWPSEVNAS